MVNYLLASESVKRRRRREGSADRGPMSSYTSFPLLIIPVIVYNAVAWGRALFVNAEENVAQYFRTEFVTVPLPTGGQWQIAPADVILTLGLLFLFLELLKATNTGKAAIFNHSLSMILFIVCLVEFLLFKPFATSVFFLITLMTLLDVLAGFIVTIVTARRDIAVGQDFGD